MSHAAVEAGAPKGLFARLVQAVVLAVLFTLLFAAKRAVPEIEGRVGTIAAVGFLLLAGTLTSELAEVVGLPHLTGYLVAGIAAGPHVLGLVNESSVEDLTRVNTLALALIAMEGGAHLRVDMLRRGLRSLAWATALQHLVVLVVMAAVFASLRGFLPFLRGFGPAALVGAGLLWGVLAATRSPSATLGILAQTRARGPVAEGTLAFVMTSDVVVVILLAGVMAVARSLLDPSASFSLHDFEDLGHEILGSIALGTTLGLVLAAYMRLVGAQLMLVFVVLGFGLTEILNYLHYEALLTFMVAGLVLQNVSKQGSKFLEAVEQAGGVVYVIFFATAGADLDLPLLRQLWPIALVLAAGRGMTTWVTARLASRLAGDGPQVRTWGWTGLISQAGVALGLGQLVERTFPVLGAGFRAIVVACVGLHEMVGPVLFKAALDRTGETSTAARPSLRPPPMPAP